ncbi:MAG: methyltransferase [Candidatus Pacearchaeota archaeon]|nr:MAG: methyltransferase [Candidatus Pacearchaeota archaeon]
MYEPREDSFLLLKHIKNYINKNDIVLDIGTGSGILAKESSKYAREVIACDINKELIKKLKRNNKNPKIKFIYSDLFSNIKGKFNLILFNPPYLPSKKIKYKEIDGGKSGTEIINRFLREAKNYLEKNGKILLLCSSLNKNVEQLFKKYQYNFKKIDEEKFFFEKLYLYELK